MTSYKFSWFENNLPLLQNFFNIPKNRINFIMSLIMIVTFVNRFSDINDNFQIFDAIQHSSFFGNRSLKPFPPKIMSFNQINQISPGISPRISPSGSPSRINVVQPLQTKPKLAYVDDTAPKHGLEVYSFNNRRWKKALNITFIGALNIISLLFTWLKIYFFRVLWLHLDSWNQTLS